VRPQHKYTDLLEFFIPGNLQTISEDLSSYVPVSSLENLVYKGQDISEVAKKPRTLKAFLSRAQ